MPIYVYECRWCGYREEQLELSGKEHDWPTCIRHRGEPLIKVIATTARMAQSWKKAAGTA